MTFRCGFSKHFVPSEANVEGRSCAAVCSHRVFCDVVEGFQTLGSRLLRGSCEYGTLVTNSQSFRRENIEECLFTFTTLSCEYGTIATNSQSFHLHLEKTYSIHLHLELTFKFNVSTCCINMFQHIALRAMTPTGLSILSDYCQLKF